jgi:serine protease AprX
MSEICLPILRKSVVNVVLPLFAICAAIQGQSRFGFGNRVLHPVPLAVPMGVTAVKVVMAQQADLSAAFAMTTKAARGQYVYNTLISTTQQTQAGLLQAVSQMGLNAQSFYIANFVIVSAPPGQTISTTQLQTLQGRSDVASIESVGPFNPSIPSASADAVTSLPAGRGIEQNLNFINAPAIWSQGAQGQGITIGIVDSGVQWDHPLLKGHYRGLLGTGANHNYNWWDAIHATLTSGTNPCGVSSTVPCDDLGHGTHITGAAVGGNATDYQIGVAPQARFMACRDMDRGYASTGSAFEECMQFMLAPWDLTGQNPDYTKAPDIVVHPYHCYAAGANCIDDPVMHMVYWNLYAAGITSVVAAEDSGPGCGSGIADWPQPYPMAIVAGALNYDSTAGQTINTIAGYSAAGPATPPSAIFKPDIAAPGTQILSSVPGGNVAFMSGTSVAASQLAGAIALILSARPSLQGRPEQIWRLIGTVPPQVVDIGSCGSPSPSPNYTYGWGNLDVNAMLSMANTN